MMELVGCVGRTVAMKPPLTLISRSLPGEGDPPVGVLM